MPSHCLGTKDSCKCRSASALLRVLAIKPTAMPDYIDILPLLTKASSSLGHNELIQSPYISLFETNSAVEIGEPRMDTGVLTAAERALPPFEVHRALLPEEIIWLMDTILGYEVSVTPRMSPLFGPEPTALLTHRIRHPSRAKDAVARRQLSPPNAA